MRTLLFAILGVCAVAVAGDTGQPSQPGQAQVQAELDAIPFSKADVPIYKKLATQRVTLNFSETSLADATAFLGDISGLNVVLSPKVDAEDVKVDLRLKDIRLCDAVYHLVRGSGLGAVVRDEAIYIAPADDLQTLSHHALAWDVLDQLLLAGGEVHGKIGRALETQKLTLNFSSTALDDVLQFLQEISGLNFVLSGTARERVAQEALAISLKVKDVKFASALNLALAGHDLEYVVRHEAVVITTCEEGDLLDAREAEFREGWENQDEEPGQRLEPLKQLHLRTDKLLSWGAQGSLVSLRAFPLLQGGEAFLAVLAEQAQAPAPKVGFK